MNAGLSRRGWQCAWVIGLCCVAKFSAAETSTPPAALDFPAAMLALEQGCADCHSEDDGDGGFSLAKVASEDSLHLDHATWLRVRQRLADHSMPPSDAEPIEIELRLRLLEWLRVAMREAIQKQG
jgi:hypothetical protein